MYKLEILVVITAITCFNDVYSYCDKNSVDECMIPITDFRKQLKISDKLQYFPVYMLNEEQLDQYCLYGEKVGRCLKKLTGCETMITRLFQGFVDSFDFLCLKTLDEYKTYQTCYAKSTVVSSLEQCDKDTSANLMGLDVNSLTAKDEYCGIVKDDYSCIKRAVQDRCGKEAAEWEVKYIKKVLSPIIDQVGCHAIPQWAIWIIIGIVSTILGVVLRFGIVAINNRRVKARTEATRVNQFHNVLAPAPVNPPAYEQVGKVV